MNEKFTKGPWKTGKLNPVDKSTPVEGSGGEIVEAICEIPHDDITDEGWEEVKANTRLITRSPDMYNLLCDLYDYFDNLSDVEDSSRGVAEIPNEEMEYAEEIRELLESVNNG